MSETEINLARAYLDAAGQDPVAALIRSVRDLARIGRALAGIEEGCAESRPAQEPAALEDMQATA